MRFVSFIHGNRQGWGMLEQDRVYDLGTMAPSLRIAIESNRLPGREQVLAEKNTALDLKDVRLLCPIPDPARIICVGQNYAAHRDEMQGAVTSYPLLFTRFPSSLVAHEESIRKPRESTQFDYEGELALIIGKAGRRIPETHALDYIAGYSCFMDGSVRDYQNHTSQYTAGKNFELSGAFGPWMQEAADIPDPNAGLRLQTLLNGKIVQDTTTDLMIFTIPRIISYVSCFTCLQAGDVIATGTPGGVGYKRQPQLFMEPGDRIEVKIEKLGKLVNQVIED